MPTDERRTLDELLRFWAAQHPRAPAISNAAISAELQLGSPAELDYRGADIVINQIAARFLSHGLTPGDAVAIQLPNTAELALIILGAMRAGLMACPLPFLWRAHEIEQAFERLPVKGIVSVNQFGGHAYGQMMCELAARHLAVRFIYGVGKELTDGQTPISDLLDPTISYATALQVFQDFPENDVEDVALVLWTVTPKGYKPVLWTHRELIAAGLQHVLAAQITTQDRLLNPYPLSSIVGVTGLFVPWLLSGIHLGQYQPFDYQAFVHQLADDNVTYTVVPAPIAEHLLRDHKIASGTFKLFRLGSVTWPHLKPAGEPAPDERTLPIYDIQNLNDVACLIRARNGAGDNTAIELGEIQSVDSQYGRLVLLETRMRGRLQETDTSGSAVSGSLFVKGLSVPNTVTVTNLGHFTRETVDPWIDTGIACTLTENAGVGATLLPPQALISHGGTIVRATELDTLYAAYDAFDDAAAFTIDDPVMGNRILAAAVLASDAYLSVQDFKSYLEVQKVASFKHPELIVLVDEIPRDREGHVLRDLLLARLS
ncbi:MAG: AMP-binding protein [Methyloligellaceae bacterium]